MNRKDDAVDRLVHALTKVCAVPGTTLLDNACMRDGLWKSMQTSAKARQACNAKEFALYLICLTWAAPAYDIAVHAGWEYARSFNWDDWEAHEAMQAIISRSQESCNGANGAKHERCYREALAEQLGLPRQDASACATGAQAEVERCLRKAHDFRFMEAAVGRVPAEV